MAILNGTDRVAPVKSRIIPFPIPAFVSPEKSVISDKIPHNICA
jgi:hypothetical protein